MNPVTWFSIPANDTEKVAAFYGSAFGWELQSRTKEDNSDFDYNVALTAESDENFDPHQRARVNGCIVKRATGITMPVVLIEVGSLDEAAHKVKSAGGKVVSETIPMKSLGGAFFLALDPEGNMVEVFARNP
ncbi:MAG: VOC family protein [Steroidobacteraceae bacterium]